MNSPSYKFSEFVDLVLVRLYELDRRDSDAFVDLSAISKDIKEEIPVSWLIDAAKVLQSRGLAQCMFTFGGVHAHISGAGRLYVEEGHGFTKQIEQNRSNYYNISVSGNGHQNVAGSDSTTQTISQVQDSGPWAKLIDSIEVKVKNDGSLASDEKEQALSYVKVVRGELRKPEPNQTIVAAVLEPLSHILSIASQVANLINAFNG